MSITVFCVSMTPGCGLVRPRGQNERGRTGRLLASVDSFDVVYEVALAAVGQRAIVTRADDFTGTIHAEAPANSLITRRSRRDVRIWIDDAGSHREVEVSVQVTVESALPRRRPWLLIGPDRVFEEELVHAIAGELSRPQRAPRTLSARTPAPRSPTRPRPVSYARPPANQRAVTRTAQHDTTARVRRVSRHGAEPRVTVDLPPAPRAPGSETKRPVASKPGTVTISSTATTPGAKPGTLMSDQRVSESETTLRLLRQLVPRQTARAKRSRSQGQGGAPSEQGGAERGMPNAPTGEAWIRQLMESSSPRERSSSSMLMMSPRSTF